MEEDLFNLLRHMRLSSRAKGADMLAALMRSCELGMLNRLRIVVDKRIEELSRARRPEAGYASMDPFSILGVSMDASEGEVKEAYKAKARKAHPDVGGSNEEMAKVNAAYEVIKRFRGWK